MNPYVFIVGCPRSGTTLLGRLLDANPELAIIHEGRFVAAWFERRRGLTPEGAVTPELIERLLDFRPFKNVDVNREQLEQLADGQAAMPYARFVSGIFDLHGAAQGKRLVGDKTPHYVRSLPTLHALWPDARFVHIVRDGRDVCLSVHDWKKVVERGGAVARYSGWERDPVATAAVWWEWQVRLGREAGATVGPQRYHEVRYESLVADPEAECRALCTFLDVPFEQDMLAFHEGRTRDDSELDAKQAWRPVTPGLRDWRTQMPADDLERFEAAAGDLLEELGYARGVPSPSRDAVQSAARARRSFAADIEGKRHRRLPGGWAG
jgi:sulfotransferase family protein